MNARDTRIALLEIIVKAQDFGDCPWCECAIGASLHHWVSTCPFKGMNTLVAQLVDDEPEPFDVAGLRGY